MKDSFIQSCEFTSSLLVCSRCVFVIFNLSLLLVLEKMCVHEKTHTHLEKSVSSKAELCHPLDRLFGQLGRQEVICKRRTLCLGTVCALELMNTDRISFQLGYLDIAAWPEEGLCANPAGKDSISLVLLLNPVSSQTSKWLLCVLFFFFFQQLSIFILLPRESVWGIVCLRFSALFSFHHPPAAVMPFQVPHAQVSSLVLCNAWPCFPGAGGVHQAGGRLQTCPLVLVSLFDWFLIPAPPLALECFEDKLWKWTSSWFMDYPLRNNQARVVVCMCFVGS